MATALEKIRGSFVKLLVISWGISSAVMVAIFTTDITESDPHIGIGIAVAVVIIGFVIPATATIIRLRGPLKGTVDRRNMTEGFSSRALKDNVQKYLSESEKDMGVLINNMKKGKVDLDRAQYGKFLDILFSTKLPYFAIDASLPSEYQKQNTTFLAAHASSLDKDPTKVDDYRILMHHADDLENDAKNDSYTDFYDWHMDHHVDLRHLPRGKCEVIMKRHNINPIECTLGMGVWGDDFAVLFAGPPDGDDTKAARLTIIEDNDARFEEVVSACKEIRAESEKVGRVGAYYSMKTRFIERWEKYVRPDERWSRIRPFMLQVLEDCKQRERTVLDAAAGMGFEFYRLRKEGHSVDANEVMEGFRDAGKEYAKTSGYETVYAPTAHTWSQMATIGWENRYGAVLVMGNSLRTMGPKSQQGIIDTFYSILKKDGVLVIDERNYDVIMKHDSVVNACGDDEDSASAFSEASGLEKTQNALYHGTNIASVPFKMTPDKDFTVCYYENTGTPKTLREARRTELQEWEFHHYVRMEKLLQNAGFSKIEKYIDYDLTKKLEPEARDFEGSMFTYVATK
ncbi:MAG: hypothetical protein MPK30_05360 [Gammaproteobacteria bacterium]|nr:hypothetical protein [Gammaproteobacteria bacterium]